MGQSLRKSIQVDKRVKASIGLLLILLVLSSSLGVSARKFPNVRQQRREWEQRMENKRNFTINRIREDKRLKKMGIDPARYRAQQRQRKELQKQAKMFAEVTRLQKAGKHKKALVMLQTAANKGNTTAMEKIGAIYLTGNGVKKDHKKAMSYYSKSAKLGGPGGCYTLGMVALLGENAPQDYNLAYRWFERAGEYAPALYMRGLMHEKELGVSKNDRKMFELYQKASHKKSLKASACLGECYLLGKGTKENDLMAHKLFSEAAARSIPKAQFYLAQMYASGKGVDKDIDKAEKLLSDGEESLKRIEASKPKTSLAYSGDTDDLMALAKRVKGVIEGGGSGPQSESKATTASKESSVPGGDSEPVMKEAPVARKAAASTKEPVDEGGAKEKTRRAVVKKGADRNLNELSDAVEKLLKTFYPKVKISKERKNIHFEYKAKQMKESGMLIQIPKLNGIVCDVTIKSGRHPNDSMLPRHTHDTLYSSLLFAPYSSSKDEHLLVKVLYPPNAAPDFLNQLKSKLRSTY